MRVGVGGGGRGWVQVPLLWYARHVTPVLALPYLTARVVRFFV